MGLMDPATADTFINVLCSIAITVLAFALVMYLILAYRIVVGEPEEINVDDNTKEEAYKKEETKK